MSRTLICLAAVAAMAGAAPAGAADAPPAASPGLSSPSPSSAASSSASMGSTAAAGPASAHAGLAVKDNTGATIGQITEIKAGVDGAQTATIQMGDQTFSVATASLGVTAEAATINMTAAEITAMVKAKS